jgi:hypothetical protein
MKSKMRIHALLAAFLGVLVVLSTGNAMAADATAPRAASAETATRPGATAALPPAAAPSMDETYASREAASKPLEGFKGGDVVIVGSTTLIIVLLVVLIIIIA